MTLLSDCKGEPLAGESPVIFSEKGIASVVLVPEGPLPSLEAMSAHDRGVLHAGFLLEAGIDDVVLVTLCESPSGIKDVAAV